MAILGMLSKSFKIDRDVLLSIVEKIVLNIRRRTQIGSDPQYYFYILVDAMGDKIKFSAADQLKRIEILTNKVSTHTPFITGVSTNLLHSILKALPSGELEISGEVGFKLSNASSSFRLDVLEPDRFPAVYEPQEHKWKRIDFNEFFNAINKVRYCTGDNDSTKHYARAVCISRGYFMCTDGFRLSVFPNRVVEGDKETLLPSESCAALHAVFKDEDAEGFMDFDDSTVYLSKGGVYVALRKVAGDAPNFVSVLPTGPCTSCVIPRDAFRDALKRIEIIAKDGERFLGVDLLVSESGLLATANRGGSSAKEIIPITYSGASISIRANLVFVREAVRSLQESEVVLEIRGKQLAIVLTDKKGEHRNVILPLADS